MATYNSQGGIKRPSDALLTGLTDLTQGSIEPIVNIGSGGSMSGYLPEWDSAAMFTGYRPQQTILRVLDLPKLFSLHPQADRIKRIAINAFELFPAQISGIKFTLEVSSSSSEIGGSGQPMEDPKEVKRQASMLNLTYSREHYGQILSNFFMFWIQWAIMHPETKRAVATTYYDVSDMLLDQYTATLLAYELDPTGRYVHRAALGCNIFPNLTGDIELTKDVTAMKDVPSLDITTGGFWMSGANITRFAQKYHDQSRFLGAQPDRMPLPVNNGAPDIVNLQHSTGYRHLVDRVKASSLN